MDILECYENMLSNHQSKKLIILKTRRHACGAWFNVHMKSKPSTSCQIFFPFILALL